MKHSYKNLSRLFLFFLSFAIISSCSDDEELGPLPIAEFSADRTVAEVNQQIQFRNNSSVPNGNASSLTFFWDFGDGLQSSNPSPTKSYTQTGMYNVVLTVTSEDGQSVTDSLSVLVGERYLSEIQFILLEDEFITIDSVTNDTIPIAWDLDGSSADLMWALLKEDDIVGTFDITSDGSINITEAPINNISVGTTIPFEFDGDFQLDDGVVELVVLDDDRDEGTVAELIMNLGFNISNLSSDEFAFNPNEFDFNTLEGDEGTDPNTGEGVFFLVDRDFPVMVSFIFFEVRLP